MEILQSVKGTSVEDILRTLNVPVHYIQSDDRILHENENGVTFKFQGENKYWVFIKEDLPEDLKAKVLCHELGHIVLGHLTNNVFPSLPESQREREADEFASFVLPYIYRRTLKGEYDDDKRTPNLYIQQRAGTHN